MNTYYFIVSIEYGYYCKGNIVVKADNPNDAKTKAQDSFINRWINTFPELDIDYEVELNKVMIDKEEVERKLKKAAELCPGDEDLEINSDGYEVRALRYSEDRGSAESIDGADEVLWYVEDAEMDNEFDPDEFINKYADAVCM